MSVAPKLTIQLCTFDRARLLERVLDGCFEQTVDSDAYEVVLVDDGSRDETPQVIAAARARATCAFTVVSQANAGLARARNAGIARSRGERILFIDDDVLPTPSLVEEHCRSHTRSPDAIVRGAVINTPGFDHLPPPVWSLANYSANYFWTSNVSVSRAAIDRVGHFSEAFREYGWEDIELGLRLRLGGVRGEFNRFAVAFHYKPPLRADRIERMLLQARAQARTAAQFFDLQPHWRVTLATGDDPLRRGLHRLRRAAGLTRAFARALPDPTADRELTARESGAARALAREAYFEELDRVRTAR